MGKIAYNSQKKGQRCDRIDFPHLPTPRRAVSSIFQTHFVEGRQRTGLPACTRRGTGKNACPTYSHLSESNNIHNRLGMFITIYIINLL